MPAEKGHLYIDHLDNWEICRQNLDANGIEVGFSCRCYDEQREDFVIDLRRCQMNLSNVVPYDPFIIFVRGKKT